MQLFSCLSPRKIKNPYTGIVQYVACRKCYACKVNYAQSWRVRLVQESLFSKYVIFFTLTYNDEKLPYFYHVGSGQIISNKDNSLFLDIFDFDSDSVCYLDSRNKIPYLFTPDIQKFVKRLRKNTNAKLRYFICGEYGPETFRAHYHGLFFTNSHEFATKSTSYIYKAWQNGFVSSSLASGKAIGYVTKYVNGSCDLPKVYECKALRPKILCSKCPPIGFDTIAKEEIKKIVFSGITRFSFFNGSKVVVSSLWSCIENTYFPKIKGFDRFSHYERVAVYRLSKNIVWESVKGRFGFYKYFKNTSLLGVKTLFNFLNENDYLLLDKKGFYSTLERNLYISRRVLNLSKKFGVSLDQYVSLIENYYNNKKYELLVMQMQFEEYFAKLDFPSRLLFLDKAFLDMVLTTNKFDLPNWVLLTLQGFDNLQVFYDQFGRFDSKTAFEYFNEKNISSYNVMFRDYFNRFSRSLKKRQKNDFVDFERFHNFNSHSI